MQAMKFPKKTRSGLIGVRGEREFVARLPDAWGYMKHDVDFGIDYMLEVWSEEEEPKLISRDIAVQVKSHDRFPKPNPSAGLPRLADLDLRAELWFEKIKSSTINYFGDSNAFILSIYLSEDRIDFAFSGLRRVLPSQLSLWVNSGIRKEGALYSICPLRPVRAELAKQAAASDHVNIPVHPLNFCPLTSYHEEEKGRTRYIYGSRFRGAFDYAIGLSRASKIIAHNNWREVIADSAISDIFDEIFRIRLAPFLADDPLKIVTVAARAALDRRVDDIADMWILFECLIAGFYFDIRSSEWLFDVIRFKSEFLSLLALRLCRYHSVSVPPELFTAYLQAGSVTPRFDCGLKPFQVDPFGCLGGKSGVREYFTEGCNYLIELIYIDQETAKGLVRHILRADEEYGVGELFGQMVEGGPSSLMTLVTQLIRTEFQSNWDESENDVTNAIRALNSIGVSCLDFSPSEK